MPQTLLRRRHTPDCSLAAQRKEKVRPSCSSRAASRPASVTGRHPKCHSPPQSKTPPLCHSPGHHLFSLFPHTHCRNISHTNTILPPPTDTPTGQHSYSALTAIHPPPRPPELEARLTQQLPPSSTSATALLAHHSTAQHSTHSSTRHTANCLHRTAGPELSIHSPAGGGALMSKPKQQQQQHYSESWHPWW